MLTRMFYWKQKKDLIEILVNNIFKILLIFILVTNCSFQKNSKFWTSEKIKDVNQENIEEVYNKEKTLDLETNPKLKISLNKKSINKSFLNNLNNNQGRINYDGDLKNISKFKFSKIVNFYQYSPEISFENKNIIFFDNKGTVLKFDSRSNLIWKKNYYSKVEKQHNPILFFANNKKILIIADNITKYYALDIKTGELLWKKNNTAPFNSEIKIYKDKFFIVDYKNTLRAFSIKNGKEIWNVKTENSLIRTQKKLSIVIVDDKIYFNNSLGDVNAVDAGSGELIWQVPTQSNIIYDENFYLKTSDLIASKDTLFFSNNKNEFFSIDLNTGSINWKIKINSSLRPTLIENYIFTVSIEGYLIVVDKNSGNIIRATDLFKESRINSKKISKIGFGILDNPDLNPLDRVLGKKTNKKITNKLKYNPTGFIVGKNNIYLATDRGRLFIIDIATGITNKILKIDSGKILRPLVLDQNLFIITDSSIIKLN